MPRRVRTATDPGEWLRRAASNLAKAGDASGVPEVLYEDLCFDAQQAAEKALKGVLVLKSVDFPKVHSISHLIHLLESNGVKVPSKVKKASILTEYAVSSRYPGIIEDVTRPEYLKAIRLAKDVVQWAAGMIEVKKDSHGR